MLDNLTSVSVSRFEYDKLIRAGTKMELIEKAYETLSPDAFMQTLRVIIGDAAEDYDHDAQQG